MNTSEKAKFVPLEMRFMREMIRCRVSMFDFKTSSVKMMIHGLIENPKVICECSGGKMTSGWTAS